MATKGEKAQPGRWRGDEVEESPDGEAERAAERVEGNTTISVADAAERAGEDESVGALPRPGRDALSPEEKIAEVAEEHRARLAAGDRGRGKI
jgi:hypothetical protein